MLMNVVSEDSFVLKTNYFILSIYSVSSYYYIPFGRVKTKQRKIMLCFVFVFIAQERFQTVCKLCIHPNVLFLVYTI